MEGEAIEVAAKVSELVRSKDLVEALKIVRLVQVCFGFGITAVGGPKSGGIVVMAERKIILTDAAATCACVVTCRVRQRFLEYGSWQYQFV